MDSQQTNENESIILRSMLNLLWIIKWFILSFIHMDRNHYIVRLMFVICVFSASLFPHSAASIDGLFCHDFFNSFETFALHLTFTYLVMKECQCKSNFIIALGDPVILYEVCVCDAAYTSFSLFGFFLAFCICTHHQWMPKIQLDVWTW